MATHDLADTVASSDGEATVTVRVTPGADATAVPSGFDEWRGVVEARVSAPAEAGAANEALLAALADALDADCRLVRGATAREKVIGVDAPADAVVAALEAALEQE